MSPRISAGEGSATELAPVTGTDAERSKRDGAGIARGAAVIAGFTVLARILGLVRTLVFSQTVGAGCLGTAYITANQVPGLVYELVLAGALSSVMVPVLARSAELAAEDPAEKAKIRQISSALLTWTVIILVPFTVLIVVAAGPIASMLIPPNPNAHCVHADVVATTASMLRVFAPQALLYGLSVVLFCLLQAYRRFAAYAVSPAVYSIVLIGAYLAFARLGKGLPLGQLPLSAELMLSVGTTAAVALMVAVGLVPTLLLRLRLRPVLRFPPGVARRSAGLAVVGLIEVIVTDIASVVVITLADGRGTTGALVIFNYASQVYNTLNGVLVVSIVLSAFPVLSARYGPALNRTTAGSTRAVLLLSFLGMALIGAITIPAAHMLAQQPGQVSQLKEGFLLFAPGLAGTAVIAILGRLMLVIGRLKTCAIIVSASWLTGTLVQVVLAQLVPPSFIVGALALGQTVGQTAAAIPLIIITRRIRGGDAIAGMGRAGLAGLGAAVAGGVVGAAISLALPVNHRMLAFWDGTLAAICALVVFVLVGSVLDRDDMRVVVARVVRFLTLPRRSRQSA